MTSDAFAQPWPGRRARGRRARDAYAEWSFAKKGMGKRQHSRPTPEELEDLIMLRRMRGGPWGGGPWGGGGGFGGPPWGGGGGPRGRGRGRARRGDVRLALLRLLAEEPRNGYQLMQTIEDRVRGPLAPEPGLGLPDPLAARGRRARPVHGG